MAVTMGLGLLLLFLLLQSIDLRQIADAIRRVRLDWVALSLLAYFGSYAFRAVRFRILLHARRPPLLDLIGVVTVHNLFNMLLPMRTGELSYVYLARQRYGASLGEGGASLVIARIYDMLGIALFFVVALFMQGTSLDGDVIELAAIGALLVGLTVTLLIFLVPAARIGIDLLERIVSSTRLSRSPLVAKGIAKLEILVGHLDDMRGRRLAPKLFVVTELQWLCTFLTCWGIVRALHIDFPFDASILGSTGLSVALILPINTFGNVGTFEAGWVAGYRLAGMAPDPATLSAVVAHVLILLFAGLLALLGRILLALHGVGVHSSGEGGRRG